MGRYEFLLKAWIHELITLFSLRKGQIHEAVRIEELPKPKYQFCDHINAKISFMEPCIRMFHRMYCDFN